MQSIFNKANNLVLIEMVKNLSPETQALWGKMSISQMLAHVYQPLLVMKGDKKIKFTFLGILMGKRLKKKKLQERGFGKNLPTHTQFRVFDPKQFYLEQQKLIDMLIILLEKEPSIITKDKHPFFGHMSIQEWDDMMYIHLNHHFNQFGV